MTNEDSYPEYLKYQSSNYRKSTCILVYKCAIWSRDGLEEHVYILYRFFHIMVA